MSYDLYSPLPVFSLANLIIATVSLGARRDKPGLAPWVSRLAAGLVLLGVGMALVSHGLPGHPGGTNRALTLSGFIIAHPAPFVIGAFALAVLVLNRRRDAA